jgi:hypothetical protein
MGRKKGAKSWDWKFYNSRSYHRHPFVISHRRRNKPVGLASFADFGIMLEILLPIPSCDMVGVCRV